jgi:probable F420-dependent oxidoreductase
MRFAISIPQYVGPDGFDAAYFRRHLARAEELGFHSAWTQEQTLGTAPTLGPLETMSYAAAVTERIRIGCSVFVFPQHSPVQLAKSLSSIDNLSHGRLEIGISAGGPGRPYEAYGVDPGTIVGRFHEGLRLMKALWTEPRVDFDGRYWQLSGAAMESKPAQKPHPPVWIGAGHPNGLRRAAQLGDGFFGAGSQTTEAFVGQVKVVREELATAGRDPAGFMIGKRVYVHVAEDAARAQATIEAGLERHYGRGGFPPIWVVGPPSACVAGLRDVIDGGAEMILLNTLSDDIEQMERLAAEVIPELS